MKPRSAKNKGVRFQNWVRDTILKYFPGLTGHVKCAVMGEKGADVQLSPEAAEIFPFAIECKNQEKWSVAKYWEQTTQEAERLGLNPLLFMTKNKHPKLAVVEAETFIEIIHRYAAYKHMIDELTGDLEDDV